MNILQVLDTIKTTDNVQIQVNLLTGLSATLGIKRTRDVVVTSSIVYETAHSILSQGMGDYTMRVLGFLRALLSATLSEAVGKAAGRARELLRVSGCLQDMTNMFLGTMMMYEETWKTLCGCLAESCEECEENQNYCSRLIPTCIQRCNARNSDSIKVLHSLLMHNARNIQIFVDSNGMSIFTRETLLDRSTMELLATLVQNSAVGNLLKCDTELMKFLYTFEEYCHGSLKNPIENEFTFQMVEWAAIILLNIAARTEGELGNSGEGELSTKDSLATEITGTSFSDLSVSFLLKENWDKFKNNMNITDHIASSDDQLIFHRSSIDLLENKFALNGVSMPKETCKISISNSIGLHTSNKAHTRKFRTNNSEPVIRQKLSASARLFSIFNNSIASIYKTVGIFRSNNPVPAKPQANIANPILKMDNVISSRKLRRIVDFKQKIRNDIVRKLKTGIYIYGCNFKTVGLSVLLTPRWSGWTGVRDEAEGTCAEYDLSPHYAQISTYKCSETLYAQYFKKISQTMWPQEKEMTPQVLYSIYRKYIVKSTVHFPACKKTNNTK